MLLASLSTPRLEIKLNGIQLDLVRKRSGVLDRDLGGGVLIGEVFQKNIPKQLRKILQDGSLHRRP